MIEPTVSRIIPKYVQLTLKLIELGRRARQRRTDKREKTAKIIRRARLTQIHKDFQNTFSLPLFFCLPQHLEQNFNPFSWLSGVHKGSAEVVAADEIELLILARTSEF